MLKIAVCDDDQIMLDLVSENTDSSLSQNEIEHTIARFLSGAEFLKAHKADPFDVVFLDIDMPEISGFDVAEKINSDERTLIIFVTTHDELVFSSLKFQPFRFMRKAYLDNEIEETVKAINDKIQKRKADRRIKFRTKENEIYIFAANIQYIEVYDHWLRVCTNDDKTFECYGSLSQFEKMLAPIGFVRTYKSYLVNFKYINSIGKTQVVLDDGTEIPLSRYKASEVREKFKDYIRGEL